VAPGWAQGWDIRDRLTRAAGKKPVLAGGDYTQEPRHP